jgi:hypothetical protein
LGPEHYYTVFQIKERWLQQADRCENEGTQMAIPANSEDLDIMKELAKGMNNFISNNFEKCSLELFIFNHID